MLHLIHDAKTIYTMSISLRIQIILNELTHRGRMFIKNNINMVRNALQAAVANNPSQCVDMVYR